MGCNAKELNQMAKNLDVLYQKLPEHKGVKETILLDAWSSATIEGARTLQKHVNKGYLTIDTSNKQYIYKLEQHIPNMY